MAEYPINKGIGRPVEFKGLKAQYLFIFAGGLLAAFVLFVILYMAGAGQWLCIGLRGVGVASAELAIHLDAPDKPDDGTDGVDEFRRRVKV